MIPGETFTGEVVRGRLTVPESIRKTLRIKDYTKIQVTVEKINDEVVGEKKCNLCNSTVLTPEARLTREKILEMPKHLSEYFSEIIVDEPKMQVFDKDFELYHLDDNSSIVCKSCYVSIITTIKRRLMRAIRSAKTFK